jgi:cytochrome c oxidase subunit 1
LFAGAALFLLLVSLTQSFFTRQKSLDLYFHDTYFVVAPAQITRSGALFLGILAGISYVSSKLFGHHWSERLGKLHFWLTMAGLLGINWPLLVASEWGRTNTSAPDVTSSSFAVAAIAIVFVALIILLAAQGLMVVNFIRGYWRSRKDQQAC